MFNKLISKCSPKENVVRQFPLLNTQRVSAKAQWANCCLFCKKSVVSSVRLHDFLFCQNLSSSTNLQMRGRPASERDRFYYFTSHDLKEYANQQNLSSLLKYEFSGRRPPKYISFFMRQSNSEGRGFVPRSGCSITISTQHTHNTTIIASMNFRFTLNPQVQVLLNLNIPVIDI